MATKENVLDILLASESFVSGELLAEKLGISRNSVWKAVTALRNEGFEIEAVTNKGYILRSEGQALSERVIRNYLLEEDRRNIYIFDSIDSTNDYAKKIAAEGAGSGTLVAADMQTKGRGRLGRSFSSPPGGSVYMSVILKPDTDMKSSQLITSCVAVAVADAIDSVCGTDVKIKWVNDLYLNGRKICGILTEAAVDFENGGLAYAVVGIGINLKSIKNVFDEELLKKATSIEDEIGTTPSRCRLIARILKNIDEAMENIQKGDFIEEYRRRSFIIGKQVEVLAGNEKRIGTVLGISDSAGLIVRYDDLTEGTVNSGEARIIM